MGHKPWDLPWRRAEKRRAKQAWKAEASGLIERSGLRVSSLCCGDAAYDDEPAVAEFLTPDAEQLPDP